MTAQEFLLFSEDEIASELSTRAKRLRIKANITQKDFAKKAGIPYATYRKFEQTGQISLLSFIKVLRHLGELKEISDLMDLDNIQKYGLEKYLLETTKTE